MKDSNWDMDLASIKLLGRHVVTLCELKTITLLRSNFSNRKLRNKLIEDIITQSPRIDREQFAKEVETYIEIFFNTIASV
jgi:hypothetical protein